MSTLYASFSNPSDAERAAGAMLDHGAQSADISLLSNQRTVSGQPLTQTEEVHDAERSAKSGISTTTAFDVAAGTIKGATIGIGVGTLAALASLFIPGLGLIVGGGALATAIMGGAGTIIAGAAAGGVAGFLADQGIPEDVVTRYDNAFREGGAILAVAVPTGDLDATAIEGLLVKYGAANIATVNAPRTLVDSAPTVQPDPLVIEPENPAIAPVAFSPAPTAVVTTPSSPVDSLAPAAVTVVPVEPRRTAVEETTEVEPTPEPLVDVIDPVTGNTIRRPVETVVPGAENAQISTLTPNREVVTDAATGNLHQTVGDPVVINEQQVVVTDPATGQRKTARLVEEQRAVVKQPLTDTEGHVTMPVEGPEQTVIVRDKHIEYPE